MRRGAFELVCEFPFRYVKSDPRKLWRSHMFMVYYDHTAPLRLRELTS